MYYSIPVIILKRLIILPNQELKIELNNLVSNKAIKEALDNYNGEILVVAPTDTLEEEPRVADLPGVGVIAKIKNRIGTDNSIQVRLKGIKRVAVDKYFTKKNNDVLFSKIMYIDLPSLIPEEEKAILKKLRETLKEYVSTCSEASNDIIGYINGNNDLDKVTDIIASYLPLDINKKLEYMQNINSLNRAKSLINDILEEIKSSELDEELDSIINEDLVDEQRKYLLKEKLKAIKSELGETNWKDEEVEFFNQKVSELKISETTRKQLYREIKKYEITNEASPEASIIHNYLDLVINLPWNKKRNEQTNVEVVHKILNDSHYGLKDIKNRIEEYVEIKKLKKCTKTPIICLVGPPGVGKTSIAMSIAKALNRKFYKISVGGLNDSLELVGSRRTYLAASPGKIIQGLRKLDTNNPVIVIDEVDKMVKDYKGDPASTLLEILDPIQNKYFTDNYVEVPFDLSNVLFILTANYVNNIPATILDRVELINLNSYTLFEKKDIANKYLLPRIKKELGYTGNINIKDEDMYFIINKYTDEAGVRELERVLSSLIRKLIIRDIKRINEDTIVNLLGNPKYDEEDQIIDNYGVVNTLAYTASGGIVTKTEVIETKGSGKVHITGNIGDIMGESIDVATTFIKSKYKYNLSNIDLHFHFLDAASKKDGPSAGVSIAVALLSLLDKKKIPSNVAFTGEISLNGSILRIGGLKEKLIGAYNKGIKVVYIPKGNVKDLDNVEKVVLDELEVIPISNFAELYTKYFK